MRFLDKLLPSNPDSLPGGLSLNFKDGRLDRASSQKLRKGLQTELGLSPLATHIFVSRQEVLIKRVFECVNAFVDTIFVSTPAIFGGGYRRILLKIIRKIFKVGSYNITHVVSQWKAYANFVLHTVAGSTLYQGNGEWGPVKHIKRNMFKDLLSIPIVSPHQELTREWLVRLAPLVNTRHMPFCGGPTTEKAYNEFIEVITSEFNPEPNFLGRLREAARRIGGIVSTIRPNEPRRGVDHISLSGSGELNCTIRQGGQAGAVRKALLRHMTAIPTESKEEVTPFGPVTHTKGIALWRTAFQSEMHPGGEFLELYHNALGQAQIIGFDSVSGKQILYCAWKDMEDIPTIRTSIVPEQGNKARIITVGPYWVNILFSPLAHFLKEKVRWHPSVFSSFTRANQAWEGLTTIWTGRRVDNVLSSDLKNATNAIPHKTAIALLEGFMEGLQLEVGPYRQLVLNLIGHRRVITPNRLITAVRGIFMGEAIAKIVLTLLSLSVEELSYMEEMNKSIHSEGPAPPSNWRRVHIGGDDHIACGPISYFKRITENFLKSGSQISPNKHGYSKRLVRYIETLISVGECNTSSYKEWLNIGWKKRMQVQTPFIDAIKMRLLSSGQSTGTKRCEKNVAFGKAKLLMTTLKKIKDIYPNGHYRRIRDLFLIRMKIFIPSKITSPKIYAMAYLPSHLGGMNLGFPEEMVAIVKSSPYPIRAVLSKILLGVDSKRELLLLRRMNRNSSNRGVELLLELKETLAGILNEGWPQEGTVFSNVTFPQTISNYKVKALDPNPDGPGNRVARLRTIGVIDVETFIEEYLRPNVFINLLASMDRQVYNTIPYIKRYKKIRNELIESAAEYGDIADEDILRAIKKSRGNMKFIDTREITVLDGEQEFAYDQVPRKRPRLQVDRYQ
jgi:hypothetical protein